MGNRILAGASSFAHLVGLAKPSAAKSKAEDDDKKDDDKEAKGAAAEDSDDDKKDASAAAAEDSDDGDEDEKKKDAKGKRAKAADEDDDDKKESASAEDDDDEEEMRGKSAAAAARRRERARCAAILLSPGAVKNPELAGYLAFKTPMTRNEAIEVLRAAPVATHAVSGRAERNPKLGPAGSGGALSSQAASAQSWDAAAKKVAALTRR